MQVSRAFAADPVSVAEARKFVVSAASDLGIADLDWELRQIVSELATNAVLHARTAFTLTITTTETLVRVEMRDASPRRVQSRSYDADASTGRGMQLIQTLSRAWGVETDGDGKTVWAELDVDSASSVDVNS
ncbi:MAG: ATP-binding protein [Actinomycetes bacterium]